MNCVDATEQTIMEKNEPKLCLSCKAQLKKRTQKKYCSRQCASNSQLTRTIRKCDICNKEILVAYCRIRNNRGKYCSQKCKGLGISQEKHWNWGGELGKQKYSERKRLMSTSRYINWRKAIINRDKECQICSQSLLLQANHIKRWVDYSELRFEVGNGILLCQNCHQKLVTGHEKEWESYFYFNLETRGYIYG